MVVDEENDAAVGQLQPASMVTADLAPIVIQRCTDCQHHTQRKTCLVPVAAGLLTQAEGFGLVWPALTYAATCPAFSSKPPTMPVGRPSSLNQAQGRVAHAEAWDDTAVARFHARVQRVVRLGFAVDDAEALAERLHLRDVDADDRVLCVECSHYRPGRCGSPARAGLASAEVDRDWATRLQRCAGHKR